MSMYGMYRQLHQPTGIEHSVFCNFFSPFEKNLVVAGSTEICVYRVNSDENTSKDPHTDPTKSKLECLGRYGVFGSVQSMKSVRLAGASRDALVLSFNEAKLSLVDYDPATHDLRTSSLHCFEEEHLRDGLLQHYHQPLVRVDPENRCAVMTVLGRHLAVLPFKKECVIDETDDRITRAPVLSSFTIDLHKLDEKVANVIDIQFLYGYYEPTLLILYEPSRTWTGRIAMRQDTCCIVAISLNIAEKAYPVIWTLTNLPYDCHMALPVPEPLGGALIFAANCLLYLNQSFPPFAVSVNSTADISTMFPLKQQEGLKIALDCCKAVFIQHDRLVMSLKGGELYVVTLLIDSMTRTVRTFNFDKAASSVLTTCICLCDEDFVFLGSRLGNSLLLKFLEKEEKCSIPTDEPRPSKRMKTAVFGETELAVYGQENETDYSISTYAFEVHDSIVNIGPCGKADMGETPFLSEEFAGSIDPDLEIVTTTGYGKNGSLSVLQRSIRPQVVTTFEAGDLSGCYDMWTLVGPDPAKPVEKDEKQIDMQGAHSYLLLSREDSTMILETGQEIMELDNSGFSTTVPTVFAGNMCGNKYILQVTVSGVCLLEGNKQVQHVPVDLGSPIVHCSVADPYIMIMSENGIPALLELKSGQKQPRLELTRAERLHADSGLITFCLYKDTSGIFSSNTVEERSFDGSKSMNSTGLGMNISGDIQHKMSVEEEDALLYGESAMDTNESTPKKVDTTANTSTASSSQTPSFIKPHRLSDKPTYWLAASRENGNFEIYSVPDFKIKFSTKYFPHGHRILMNTRDQPVDEATQVAQCELLPVKELLIAGLGHKASRVHLLARVEEDLYLYEAFPYQAPNEVESDSLKLRFKRVEHGLALMTKKGKAKPKKENEADDEESKKRSCMSQLRLFSDISGYNGVFICGPYPHWLFMTSRGAIRLHPMSVDGSVTSFAPFHNVNCQKGFLYFNRKGEMRICALPTHLLYDNVWPMRKVALRCTPHFVLYHPGSSTYMVCTSQQENCAVYPRWEDEDIVFDPIEVNDRYVYPPTDKFALQLYTSDTWEAIPGSRIEFDEFEHVTCVAHVSLKCEGTFSGKASYIVVGTNSCYGEELTARGKIILMEIIEVVPEPGQPLTKTKLKQICTDEQKGPVTAITHVAGLLITAIGQKIYIWQLKDNQISPVSFIDTQIYIHCIVTVKNLVIIADILKGLSLLRYQSDMRVLSVASKENKPVEIFAMNYLVDNQQLGFMITGREKNLSIYSYEPTLKESGGGQWLVRKADMNLGVQITNMFRVKCKLTDPSSDRKPAPIVEKRQVTYFTTLEGSIGCILPISEKTYRRLFMLQNFLDTHLPHYAGLNPKTFRIFKSKRRQLINPQKNIIDGNLVWKYLTLNHPDKVDLAKKMGTSVQQINDDILEVDRLTAHF